MYEVGNQEIWNGRVDSEEDFLAFRWHQHIEMLNLNDDIVLEEGFKIGFIGYKCDLGITINKGRAGAKEGPDAIRKEMCNLPCMFEESFKLYDCGNIVEEEIPLEEIQGQLSFYIEKMLSLGVFPIVLGGGHDLSYGHYNGLRKKYGNLSIVNLDAHFDMRPYDNGASSGTMFRQISDELLLEGKELQYLCLGAQKRGNTLSLFHEMKKRNMEYILAKDIIHDYPINTFEKIAVFTRKSKNIYMTLCTDVISSAFAPGVSAVQPLGIDPERTLEIIKAVIKTKKLVAFDVAEVSPKYDVANTTASLAATFIFGLVNELTLLHGLGVEV